jgi:ABC-2 type transport system ATP-binding protein/sodium transport system ATP-binding protein
MIHVHELRKVFPLPDGRELVAVDGISFSVAPGEVFGLLGPNGAGKTTTLRMLLGLLTPTSGYAEIDGVRSCDRGDEVKMRVGLVSTQAGVYQYQTVREMLLYFADLYRVPEPEARRRVADLAGQFGFADLLDRACAQLSTGQKQRVNLARALVHEPPVLLLDEPTLGLDVWGSRVIYGFVEKMRSQGKSVIVCTHHLDDAERLCTRFGLMDHGRIALTGDLAEVLAAGRGQNLVDVFLHGSMGSGSDIATTD